MARGYGAWIWLHALPSRRLLEWPMTQKLQTQGQLNRNVSNIFTVRSFHLYYKQHRCNPCGWNLLIKTTEMTKHGLFHYFLPLFLPGKRSSKRIKARKTSGGQVLGSRLQLREKGPLRISPSRHRRAAGGEPQDLHHSQQEVSNAADQ